MGIDHKNPLSFLPLTPFAFQVLLALADGDRHGYAIIKEVEERSGGTVKLRTGTLYTLLQRLLEEQLIGEIGPTPASPTADAGPAARADSRRRYYRLTALGDAVLRAEAQRLEGLIGDARRKHVLSDAGGV
ncbi:MAG TPA: helix-turn-helix transcriptional regulator [Vicinamibacterales bacterium]|nr:helix-turn-helix transcriptional regulator [Vicinamibacterales bacterium]